MCKSLVHRTCFDSAARRGKVLTICTELLQVCLSCSNAPTFPAPISCQLAARQRREKGAAAAAASSPAAYQRGASLKVSQQQQQQQHKGDEAAPSSRAADASKQSSSSNDASAAPSIQISGRTCAVSSTFASRRSCKALPNHTADGACFS
jgi:hypothetical protein